RRSRAIPASPPASTRTSRGAHATHTPTAAKTENITPNPHEVIHVTSASGQLAAPAPLCPPAPDSRPHRSRTDSTNWRCITSPFKHDGDHQYAGRSPFVRALLSSALSSQTRQRPWAPRYADVSP